MLHTSKYGVNRIIHNTVTYLDSLANNQSYYIYHNHLKAQAYSSTRNILHAKLFLANYTFHARMLLLVWPLSFGLHKVWLPNYFQLQEECIMVYS